LAEGIRQFHSDAHHLQEFALSQLRRRSVEYFPNHDSSRSGPAEPLRL